MEAGNDAKARVVEMYNSRKARCAKAMAQLRNPVRALGLAFRATRGWTLTWGVLLLLQGMLPVARRCLSSCYTAHPPYTDGQCRPVDVAAIALLASDDASKIAGALLPVDRGITV